jgi:hypothetical protein
LIFSQCLQRNLGICFYIIISRYMKYLIASTKNTLHDFSNEICWKWVGCVKKPIKLHAIFWQTYIRRLSRENNIFQYTLMNNAKLIHQNNEWLDGEVPGLFKCYIHNLYKHTTCINSIITILSFFPWGIADEFL